MTLNDRDAMIRLALSPAPDAIAPADLADAISREVLATPQRRGIVRLGRLGWVPAPAPLLLTLGLLLLLGVAILIAARSQVPPPILSTYHGGPDRTGVMPGPGPAGTPVVLWDVARPGPFAFTSMPMPVGDRVLVADGAGFLAALDAATGATVWELDVGGRVFSAPAIADGLAIVGTDDGEVVAADVATGRVVWRRQLAGAGELASPLVVEGFVYVGTADARLVALAPADGQELWAIGDLGGAVTRGPSFADGVIYVGAHGGRLSAIDAASHAVRWAIQLGEGDVGTPSVGDGRVFVGRGLEGGAVDHDLVALDARDGRILWTFASPGGQQVHMGALAHGRVYATGEDGVLYALDPATGGLQWKVEIGGRLATDATVAGDTLYVTSTTMSIHAIDANTATELWQLDLDGDPTMGAVIDGRVFIGTNFGRVIAIGGSTP